MANGTLVKSFKLQAIDGQDGGTPRYDNLNFVRAPFRKFAADDHTITHPGTDRGIFILSQIVIADCKDLGNFAVEQEPQQVEMVRGDFDEGPTATRTTGFPRGNLLIRAWAVPDHTGRFNPPQLTALNHATGPAE